jgi:hypothetical protein
MVGHIPSRGDRHTCVAETRPGGLPGAYNITSPARTDEEGAGGWAGDLLNLSASGRDKADVIRRSLKAARQQVTFPWDGSRQPSP